jgi:hypothetical protein
MLDRVLRVPKRAMLVVALGAALGAIGLAALLRGPEHSDDLVTTREAAKRLKQEAQRQRISVYRVRCVRVDHLRRSFDCFTEGADDLHLAYRVTVDPDGRLVVRPPEK